MNEEYYFTEDIDRELRSPQRNNNSRPDNYGLAIASMILGIISLVFFLFGLIIGRGTLKLPEASAPERYVPAAAAEPAAENPPLREEDLNFKEALQSEGTANIIVAGLNKNDTKVHYFLLSSHSFILK